MSNRNNIFFLICALYLMVLPGAWIASYFYRKLAASVQARVGPRMAGPMGILQGPADWLKLLQRNPGPINSRLHSGWYWGYWFIAFSSLALLPWGPSWPLHDVELSILIPAAILCPILFSGLLMGLSQRSFEGFLGSMRHVSQGVSALLPIWICLISVGMRAGGYSWSRIEATQGPLPYQWLVFSGPLYWLCFLVFLICGPVVFGITPGEGQIHSLEIRGGVTRALEGHHLALYRFSALFLLLFWSVLAVSLFLGGAMMPIWLQNLLGDLDSPIFLTGVRILIVGVKTGAVLLFYFWLGIAFPKNRSDHLVALNWRVLSFLSLFAMVGNTVWVWLRGIS